MSPAQEATTKDRSKAQVTNEPYINPVKGHQFISQAKEIGTLKTILPCITTTVGIHFLGQNARANFWSNWIVDRVRVSCKS